MSAGAMASPLYAGIIAEKYPQVRVLQIGDSGGGLRHEAINSIMVGWGVQKVRSKLNFLAEIDSDALDFESLYIGAGRQTNLSFTQVNYLDDPVLAKFLRLLGATEPNVRERVKENLQEISGAVPSFRYYNIPGNYHMVLCTDGFYTTSVNDISLSDWVRALVESKDIKSVDPTSMVVRP